LGCGGVGGRKAASGTRMGGQVELLR
jgi:hypothetical protein